MPSIKIFNQQGKDVGVKELEESVFGAEYNEGLIHQVVVAQANNARQGTKSTLTRTEVRGGGRKPWRQKGTGHARQGSIRAPQWIKGGVVFAPKPRDFSQKVNKVAKRRAFISALSAKLADGDLVCLDKLTLSGKTKEMAAVMKALNLGKRVLLVTEDIDAMVMRSAANIPGLTVTYAAHVTPDGNKVCGMNVRDLLMNAVCVMTEGAIDKIQEAYKA